MWLLIALYSQHKISLVSSLRTVLPPFLIRHRAVPEKPGNQANEPLEVVNERGVTAVLKYLEPGAPTIDTPCDLPRRLKRDDRVSVSVDHQRRCVDLAYTSVAVYDAVVLVRDVEACAGIGDIHCV